jgi:hypothetical protein
VFEEEGSRIVEIYREGERIGFSSLTKYEIEVLKHIIQMNGMTNR